MTCPSAEFTVNYTAIKAKSIQYAAELGIDFNTSDGKTWRWMRCYCVCSVILHGEGASADIGSHKVQTVIKVLRELMEVFDIKLMFNMDET